MKMLALFAIGVAAMPASAAAYTNIWSTSFDSGSEYESTGPFAFGSLSTTYGGAAFESAGSAPGLGTKFFRNATAGTTTFSAFGLGAHTSLKLSFDLVFVDSWDGADGPCCSPDFLTVNVNGVTDNYTASIALGSSDYFGPGTLTAFGSYLGNPIFADKIVRYDLIIPHSASSFFVAFNAGGSGFQYGDDESWGIDNFSLSALAVPEPATWTMMIFGFGITGYSLRTRRRTTASVVL